MATTPPPKDAASLNSALQQNEQATGKVEQAALELSVVNAALQAEIAQGASAEKLAGALNDNQAIEVKVQEAATQLAAVHDALVDDLDQRRQLENQLSTSHAALSESITAEQKLTASALHDPLTGLGNLTLFNDRLSQGLAQAQRHSRRLAVMFIDLDQFKAVNDAHGHDLGDQVLTMVAARLKAVVRAGDTVCRRSGDEFLFLMLEVNDEADVKAFAARMVSSIANAFEIGGVQLSVIASVGIALYPEHGHSAAELLKNADLAMYAAKAQKLGPVLHSQTGSP